MATKAWVAKQKRREEIVAKYADRPSGVEEGG